MGWNPLKKNRGDKVPGLRVISLNYSAISCTWLFLCVLSVRGGLPGSTLRCVSVESSVSQRASAWTEWWVTRVLGTLLLSQWALLSGDCFYWLVSRRQFCVNPRAVSSSGSLSFITWSGPSGACCALEIYGDRNARLHHPHQHAVSLRALLLMFHFSSTPKPQEDGNSVFHMALGYWWLL